MEATVHEAYIKAGKLRQWLQKPSCPEVMKECSHLLNKATAPKVHGDEDWGTPAPREGKAQKAPKDLEHLLGRNKVHLLPRVSAHGVQYSTASAHLGSSLIFYYPNGNTKAPTIPGSIQYIYRKGDGVYFAIRRQLPRPLDDTSPDPFALYPDFPARLYQNNLANALEEVAISWTLCHYARWEMSKDRAVVLQLLMVSDPNLAWFYLPPDSSYRIEPALSKITPGFMCLRSRSPADCFTPPYSRIICSLYFAFSHLVPLSTE
jgi:hypothetical protein